MDGEKIYLSQMNADWLIRNFRVINPRQRIYSDLQNAVGKRNIKVRKANHRIVGET